MDGAGGRIGEISGKLRRASAGASRRPHRLRRGALAATLAVLAVFATATARLFVWPAQGMPPRVSAIVMLAGPGDRLETAVRLAWAGRAPVLVVSRGHEGYGSPCPGKISGVSLICFEPDPSTTQGEAQVVGRLAKRYHWRSLVLVTTRAQDTRARIRVERCYSGTTYVVAAPQPLRDVPYQLAYEWAATFKALFLQRAC